MCVITYKICRSASQGGAGDSKDESEVSHGSDSRTRDHETRADEQGHDSSLGHDDATGRDQRNEGDDTQGQEHADKGEFVDMLKR